MVHIYYVVVDRRRKRYKISNLSNDFVDSILVDVNINFKY